MAEFFKNFPLTTYANTLAIDLTRRVGLTKSLVADRRAYLPYEVPAGMRADQVAQYYYGDPSYTWAVYMSADKIDPYDWYKPINEFNDHIAKKYGSMESAEMLTHHYQLDWAPDDSRLQPNEYAALDPDVKKYWDAVFGVGTRIVAYTRREEDWTAATNMTVSVTVSGQGGNVPAAGEVVQVYDANLAHQGSCEVAWGNSTTLVVHHVETGLAAGLTMTTNTGANALITEMHYVSNTIPVNERPYWARVTMLDHETEKNESLKSIRLVDKKYSSQLDQTLRKVLK